MSEEDYPVGADQEVYPYWDYGYVDIDEVRQYLVSSGSDLAPCLEAISVLKEETDTLMEELMLECPDLIGHQPTEGDEGAQSEASEVAAESVLELQATALQRKQSSGRSGRQPTRFRRVLALFISRQLRAFRTFQRLAH